MRQQDLQIVDYTYHLPEEHIALYPLEERDDSKLLVYQEGKIEDGIFSSLPNFLPQQSRLVFNNTKVIHARILFQKATGGNIEIFCLEPAGPIKDYSQVMLSTQSVQWKCLIGGASKWKSGPLEKTLEMDGTQVTLSATLEEKLNDAYLVQFSWTPAALPFANILSHAGDLPLPPYLHRQVEASDAERYQTVYAQAAGSVAAPTAGLHFTPTVLSLLDERNINQSFVTLHVGAGTFKPVKSEKMEGHDMHAEWMEVERSFIETLATASDTLLVAVGTTSLRTLESLYWMGVKAYKNPHWDVEELTIGQWEVYGNEWSAVGLDKKVAMKALLHWMDEKGLSQLIAATRILIAPGYRFRIAEAIITNFHQPQSTLLLLVAAAVGEDWRKIYGYAMEQDFRFLSYGDSSLLFIKPENRSV